MIDDAREYAWHGGYEDPPTVLQWEQHISIEDVSGYDAGLNVVLYDERASSVAWVTADEAVNLQDVR